MSIIVLSSDHELIGLGRKIYQDLLSKNYDVLLDDSENTAGQKFSIHDLIGTPIQVIISNRNYQN